MIAMRARRMRARTLFSVAGLLDVEYEPVRVANVTARNARIFLGKIAPGSEQRTLGPLHLGNPKIEHGAVTRTGLDIQAEGTGIEADESVGPVDDREAEDGLVEPHRILEFLSTNDDIAGSSKRVRHVNLREPSLRRVRLQQFDTVDAQDLHEQ